MIFKKKAKANPEDQPGRSLTPIDAAAESHRPEGQTDPKDPRHHAGGGKTVPFHGLDIQHLPTLTTITTVGHNIPLSECSPTR